MAENKKGFFHEILKPTLVLLIICIVISGALAVTNYITRDKIAEQDIAAISNARKILVPDPDVEFDELSLDDKDEMGFIAKKGSTVLSYIFVTYGKGYKSDVTVMTDVHADGTVAGVLVIDCSGETPGLGQKAGEESGDGLKLRESFKGKTTVDADSKEDCMTGATITSKAVKRAVARALELYKTLSGGAN